VAFDVRFATLDLTDLLDDPTFESSFRTEFIATVAASAGVGTHRVSVAGYSAGSAVVSTVVYFPSSAAADSDAFVNTLNFVPANVFASSATLSSSYGLITASMAAEPPAPVVEVQAQAVTPPASLAARPTAVWTLLLATTMLAALLLA
jgi:hypothetical protein